MSEEVVQVELLEETGITDELVSEIKALQTRLSEWERLVKLLGTPLLVEDLSKDKLRIRGILLGEGQWNGIQYTADEIKKMVDKLANAVNKGKIKIFFDVEHGRDKEFLDEKGEPINVGYLESLRYVPEIKACVHTSIIDNPKAIELIRRGELKGVSASLLVTKKLGKDGTPLATNIDLLKVSLVREPACSFAYNMYIEQLMRKDSLKEEDESKPEVESMSVDRVEETKEEIEEQAKKKKKEEYPYPEEEEKAKKKKAKKGEEGYYYYPPPDAKDFWKEFEKLIDRLEKVVDKLEKKLSKAELSEEEKVEEKPEEKKEEVKEETKPEAKEPEKKEEPKEEPKREEVKKEEVKEEPKPEIKEEPKKSIDEIEKELVDALIKGEISYGELIAKLSKYKA